MSVNIINIIALGKVVKDKAMSVAREGLTAGIHYVDYMVHITGSIKVGEDSFSEKRSEVKYKNAFATLAGLLIKQCKLQKNPLSDELIEDLISMAMKQGDTAQIIADEVMKIVETIEYACTKVADKKVKKGTITTKLAYEIK